MIDVHEEIKSLDSKLEIVRQRVHGQGEELHKLMLAKDEHRRQPDCLVEFTRYGQEINELKSKETTMAEDIKTVKEKLNSIELSVAKLPGELSGMMLKGVAWVLGVYSIGAILCAVTVGKVMNQVEDQGKKWEQHDKNIYQPDHSISTTTTTRNRQWIAV